MFIVIPNFLTFTIELKVFPYTTITILHYSIFVYITIFTSCFLSYAFMLLCNIFALHLEGLPLAFSCTAWCQVCGWVYSPTHGRTCKQGRTCHQGHPSQHCALLNWGRGAVGKAKLFFHIFSCFCSSPWCCNVSDGFRSSHKEFITNEWLLHCCFCGV